MKYEIIHLSKYPIQPITDFSKARNYFLERNPWTLFIDDDEEPCQMLLDYLDKLTPEYPYYGIRVIGLRDGKYDPLWNPLFQPALVSNKVRFVGRVHEKVQPRKPWGLIDFPIIHNHVGPPRYSNYQYMNARYYHYYFRVKKALEILRGRG